MSEFHPCGWHKTCGLLLDFAVSSLRSIFGTFSKLFPFPPSLLDLKSTALALMG